MPRNKYILYQLDSEKINIMNPFFINLVKNSKYTFDYSEVNLTYYPPEVKDTVSYFDLPVLEFPYSLYSQENKYDVLFRGYKNEIIESSFLLYFSEKCFLKIVYICYLKIYIIQILHLFNLVIN